MKFTTLLVPLALLAACASATPTPELVTAREAYYRAEHAPESRLAPASLLSARQALDRAEAAHKDDAQSNKERSLAYVAQRRAELALIDGKTQAQRNRRAEIDRQYEQTQTKRINASQDQVRNLNAQLYSQGQRANQSEQELQLERQRTQNALASLERVAQVKEEARGTVVTLSGQVLFLSGKSELLPSARDQLQTVAKALIDQGDSRSISIEGYTDSRGDESANMTLSQQRADAVRTFLISSGVPAERMTAVGKGESSPVASNDTAEGRANNRRVELILSNQGSNGRMNSNSHDEH
ncbi:MAG TPA: OmpA family protein [Polyangiaceae bacterium]|jgi:outer membrane protein OmpA-like peptidoglycan-associated protein|nr:OmpA family protein [Polyangiaceae bacterium]